MLNKYEVTLPTGCQMEFLARDIEDLEYLVLSELALGWSIKLLEEGNENESI